MFNIVLWKYLGILNMGCNRNMTVFWVYKWYTWCLICVSMTVCVCHITYAFQSESTLYSCLNVKELLARSRREIWSLSDCNWTRTQNHLVFLYELNGSGFESSCCSHLNKLKMNKFMFNVRQSKMNRFINYIWQLIINASNATFEVPSPLDCQRKDIHRKNLFSTRIC